MMPTSCRSLALAALLSFTRLDDQARVAAFNTNPACTKRTLFSKQKNSMLSFATSSSSKTEIQKSDVTIPYDAASLLAYDEWRAKFNKGDFNSVRYEAFKANYEAITVYNVIAARKERELQQLEGKEMGANIPSRMELNEVADMTLEEYKKFLQQQNLKTELEAEGGPSKSVMNSAREAAAKQADASTALDEASSALAQEEQELAEKLGLKSVEELEAAVDAMEGIAEDGSALAKENFSREARIRSAYLDWCKKYVKKQNEKRFEVFERNFLAMEEYAKRNNKDMILNEYADCTEEEYRAATSPATKVSQTAESDKPPTAKEKSPLKPETKAEPPIPSVDAPASPTAAPSPKAKRSTENPFEFPGITLSLESDEERSARMAKQKADTEAAYKKRIEEAEESRKLKAKVSAKASAESEKDRQARQAAQVKDTEKQRLEAEAEAIASARKVAEEEALQSAKRRALLRQSVEMERQISREKQQKFAKLKKVEARQNMARIARDAERLASKDKQFAKERAKIAAARESRRKLSELPALPAIFQSTKKTSRDSSQAKNRTIMAKKAAEAKLALNRAKKEAEKRAAQLKAKQVVAKKNAEIRAKQAAEKIEVELKTRQEKAKAAFRKTEEAAASMTVSKQPAASVTQRKFRKEGVASSDAVTDALKSFFGSSEKKVSPNMAPRSAPPKKSEAPGFPFFFGKSRAPNPSPVVKSATKKKEPAFYSLFSKPKEETKILSPRATEKTKSPFLSLFSIAPAKKSPKASPATKNPRFSIFSGPPQKKTAPFRRSSTISIKSVKSENKKASVMPFLGGTAGGITAAKKTTADAIPVLRRFVQNSDGSLTGVVSNSKTFRNGTKITTSPVRRGVKAGMVVQTGSGSRYRLQ